VIEVSWQPVIVSLARSTPWRKRGRGEKKGRREGRNRKQCWLSTTREADIERYVRKSIEKKGEEGERKGRGVPPYLRCTRILFPSRRTSQ